MIFGILVALITGNVLAAAQGQCNPDLRCANCTGTGTNQSCTSCPIGYGLTSDQFPTCQACPQQCNLCKIGSPCTQCFPQYGPTFTFPYDCAQCIQNCNGCQTNVSYCDTCDFGYYLYANRSCGPCATNCNTYKCAVNGAGKCDRCDFGYGLTPTNTCAPCASNCNAGCDIARAGKCDQCNSGYGKTANGTCLPCSNYCTYGCNATGAGKCDKCNLGYGFLPDGSCSLCDVNCNNTVGCNASGTCIQCNRGYALTSTSTCGACDPNCNNAVGCNTNGTCLLCNRGYGLTSTSTCGACDLNCNNSVGCNSSGTCLLCNRGYGLTSTSTCGACDPNCNNSVGCNSSGTCLLCNRGYGLTSTSTCGVCDINCNNSVGCKSGGTCLQCNRGFGLTSNNTCGACDPNCNNAIGCNVSATCFQCNTGFTLYPNNTCGVITTTATTTTTSTTATTTTLPSTVSAGTSTQSNVSRGSSGNSTGSTVSNPTGTASTASGATPATGLPTPTGGTINTVIVTDSSGRPVSGTSSTRILTTTSGKPMSGNPVSSVTIEPTYGTAAGGTAVTIAVTWTRSNVSIVAVYFGSNLKADNLTHLTATDYNSLEQRFLMMSPSITNKSLIDQPLPISLAIYPNPVNISTGKFFTYKPNPEIYDIQPRVIPLSGGIRLNVTGRNLGSAIHPFIRALVVVWSSSNNITYSNASFGRCNSSTDNETQMNCLSPPVYIPKNFLLQLFGDVDPYSRRKREIILSNSWWNKDGNIQKNDQWSTLKSRSKRSISIRTNQTYTSSTTQEQMKVYIDGIFDGYEIPLDSILNFGLYDTPILSCKDSFDFDPKQDSTIAIKGVNMKQWGSKADYTVRIGSGFCNVTDLTDNELTCSPPKTKPQQTADDSLYNCGENFVVLVGLGYKTYKCSCLRYSDKSTTILIIIITVTVGSAFIIIIAIIVISIIIKRTRTPRKSSTQGFTQNQLRPRGTMTNSSQSSDTGNLETSNIGSAIFYSSRINNDFNTSSAGEYFTQLPRPIFNQKLTNQPYKDYYRSPNDYTRFIEANVGQARR